ncbi:MAG: HAD family phosphatase [Candidatus Berkelbacteria bacterium]|nr:HAD family phosphatase [Candidatus Berkelbacteria bacterium]
MINNLKKIKVIAFDFWGVFADLEHPMYGYIKKHGVDPEKYSESIHDYIIAHDLGEITEKEFLQKVSDIIGLGLPYKKCHLIFKKETVNRQLIKVVEKLKNKFRIFLLTNNPKEYCQIYLFDTGLDKLFDDIIISCQVKYRKPAKEIYEVLIKKANVKPSEILFIDDDASKFSTAEKLGIKTLRYFKGRTDRLLESLI